MKKIAIMTAGGDCCGLNAAIKTVVCEAQNKGIEVVGILDGACDKAIITHIIDINISNTPLEEIHHTLQVVGRTHLPSTIN